MNTELDIQFKIRCRHCFNEIENYFNHNHEDAKLIKIYKERTEFEVMMELKELIEFNQLTCPKCRSSNIETHDISINGYHLNDNYLAAIKTEKTNFEFNIDKKKDSLLVDNNGSSNPVHLNVFRSAIEHALGAIELFDISVFEPQDKGKFTIKLCGELLFRNIPVSIQVNVGKDIKVGQKLDLKEFLKSNHANEISGIQLSECVWSSSDRGIIEVDLFGNYLTGKSVGVSTLNCNYQELTPVIKIHQLSFYGISKKDIVNSLNKMKNDISSRSNR